MLLVTQALRAAAAMPADPPQLVPVLLPLTHGETSEARVDDRLDVGVLNRSQAYVETRIAHAI